MRLDSVEIKVTLSSEHVEAAVAEFGLGPDGRRWQIYFCEDVVRGNSPATPLLDAGVVLRARHRGGDKADATVKLRPARRSQLSPEWLQMREGDDWEFKVEADWAGDRRVLAASITADRTATRLDEVRAGQASLSRLFHDDQRRFLDSNSPVRINLDMLTLLPPVAAVRWPEFEAEPKLSLRAERWTVDDLDFLELSAVADPEDAPARQTALHRFVAAHGFPADPGGESKTSRVVGHLVAVSARLPIA
ncbi:hypothetical protein AB0M02_24485 [Actinoplanes sp. NPDC051861]|uniref:hypothetical protein n=1 Tax=Actinoplanes sp. NPDC051861 TaxID=3155170 RepID=UPI00343F765A